VSARADACWLDAPRACDAAESGGACSRCGFAQPRPAAARALGHLVNHAPEGAGANVVYRLVQAEAAVPAAAAMAAAAAAPAPACEAAQRVKPAKAKRQALSGWARAAGGALLAAAAFAAHHSQPLPCGAADNDAAPSLPPELLPLLPCLNAAGLPPSPRWVRRGC
jgi:hypothetical protein